MNAKEISELLRAKPFRPLTVHLADGRHFDVKHPEQALLSRSTLVFGVGEDQEYNIADRFEHIALLHITGITKNEASFSQ